MKRKIFTFAIVGLLSLTVTSCQTETKLDANDGKELIATSFNKSKQNVIEVINGDFLGADIKIKCVGCGRIVMIPRLKFQKDAKKVVKSNNWNKNTWKE